MAFNDKRKIMAIILYS